MKALPNPRSVEEALDQVALLRAAMREAAQAGDNTMVLAYMARVSHVVSTKINGEYIWDEASAATVVVDSLRMAVVA